jgi:hypothetical protein
MTQELHRYIEQDTLQKHLDVKIRQEKLLVAEDMKRMEGELDRAEQEAKVCPLCRFMVSEF